MRHQLPALSLDAVVQLGASEEAVLSRPVSEAVVEVIITPTCEVLAFLIEGFVAIEKRTIFPALSASKRCFNHT